MAVDAVPVPSGMKLLLYGNKETGRILYAEADGHLGVLLFSLLMKTAGNLLERLREWGVGAPDSAFYSLFSSVDSWHPNIARLGGNRTFVTGTLIDTWKDVRRLEVKACKGSDSCQHCTAENTPCEEHGSRYLQLAFVKLWTQGYIKEGIKLLVTDGLQVLPLNTASIALAQKQLSGEKEAALHALHSAAVTMTKEQAGIPVPAKDSKCLVASKQRSSSSGVTDGRVKR